MEKANVHCKINKDGKRGPFGFAVGELRGVSLIRKDLLSGSLYFGFTRPVPEKKLNDKLSMA